MSENKNAAVEANRQDHVRDATKMVPSDEDIANWVYLGQSLVDPSDVLTEADFVALIRAALSRYGSSQPTYEHNDTPMDTSSGHSGKPAASVEPSTHIDDDAVDHFAVAMKEKLAQARAKGRSRWFECDPADLSAMLRAHVEKGDPRDVANFCCFLWSLGKPISVAPVAQEPVAWLVEWKNGGKTWVQAHASEVPARDQALHQSGRVTELYAAPVAAHAQPRAQDREDAERWRWLRDTPRSEWPESLRSAVDLQQNAILDREIDAARAAKEE